MTLTRSSFATRLIGQLATAITLASSGALTSACADTENRFNQAETESAPDAATDEETLNPSDARRSEARSAAAGNAAVRSDSANQAGSESVPPEAGVAAPPLPASAPPVAAAGSGSASALGAAGAATPDVIDPTTIDEDASLPVGPSPGATVDCSFEFEACVMRTAPRIAPCLEKFSTCGGVLMMASDGGVEATCALQLTACVLDEPAAVGECTTEYTECMSTI